MSICDLNAPPCASGLTSGSDAGAQTIVGRLRANTELPDIADFLRLVQADGPDVCLSYRGLLGRAAGFAEFYRESGLRPQDRVVIILRHSAELYAAFVGALLAGCVPSYWPFPSPKISDDEYRLMVRALLQSNRPRLLVTYPSLTAAMRAASEAAGPPVTVCSADEVAGAGCDTPWTDAGDPGQTAFLQYSSGTTGLKKGVAISHRALLWQVDRYAEAIGLNGDDRIVSWLPLYHDMGLIACLFMPLIRRVPLVAMCPFAWVQRPAMWLRAVSEFGCTLSWMPNFAYGLLARSVTEAQLAGVDLRSLRGVVNCSEPILASSQEEFLRRLAPAGLRRGALCASYALAENTFAATSGGFGGELAVEHVDGAALTRSGRAVPVAPGSPEARVLVSSGRALPETEIAIVDESGTELGERQVGEIALRSSCLLAGYDRNEEATRRALRDGRYYTGDMGFMAAGELFVIGRKDDMLIVRGQNIYPQDVEDIVSRVDGVIPGRVAAVGVRNDDSGTEALVILAETEERDDQRREAIAREIHARVARATEVVPADVVVLDHMWLRKSTSGKISRSINRDRYLAERQLRMASARAGAGPARPGGSTLAAMRECVLRVVSQSVVGRSFSIGDDEPLISSGLIDSLSHAALLTAIETEFGVSIPAGALTRLDQVDSVRALAALVESLRGGRAAGEGPSGFPTCPEDVPLVTGEARDLRRTRGSWSWYYRLVFRRHGVRVGAGLRVLGGLILRFDGDARNITIGNNVTLMPGVDLKVRENGKIVLGDGVVLDTNVRLVAAREGRIVLGENVQLGMCTTINAGKDVIIGRRTAIAGFSLIVASEHNYMSRAPFMEQGYRHDPVYIGEDVWGGAYVFIGRGSRIGNGAVLGIKSVVKGDVPAYAVVSGNPARIIRFRG